MFQKIPLSLKVLVLLLPLFPLVASAAGTPSIWPTGFWGPLVSCTGNYIPGAATSQPSCTSLCDLILTIINIVYFGMSLAIFIFTPVSFLVGGIMMMVSGANPELLSKGKKIVTGTLVGLGLVLGSYLIIFTVIKALGATGVGGFGTAACTVSAGTPIQ